MSVTLTLLLLSSLPSLPSYSKSFFIQSPSPLPSPQATFTPRSKIPHSILSPSSSNTSNFPLSSLYPSTKTPILLFLYPPPTTILLTTPTLPSVPQYHPRLLPRPSSFSSQSDLPVVNPINSFPSFSSFKSLDVSFSFVLVIIPLIL